MASDDEPTTKPSFRDTVTAGLVQKALEPVIRAVREEVAAARQEVRDRVGGARTGLVLVGAAVGAALTTSVLLAGFAVAALALALPLWAATGIVFVVFAVATAVLGVVGVRGLRRGVPPVPKDTLRSARERLTADDADASSGA